MSARYSNYLNDSKGQRQSTEARCHEYDPTQCYAYIVSSSEASVLCGSSYDAEPDWDVLPDCAHSQQIVPLSLHMDNFTLESCNLRVPMPHDGDVTRILTCKREHEFLIARLSRAQDADNFLKDDAGRGRVRPLVVSRAQASARAHSQSRAPAFVPKKKRYTTTPGGVHILDDALCECAFWGA
eukprot:6177073-Pleurochrysis_carterae.AAC.3